LAGAVRAQLRAAGSTGFGRKLGLGPDLGVLESNDGLKVTLPKPTKAVFSEDDGGAVFEVEHKGGCYRLDARRFKSYKEIPDEPPAHARVTQPSW
jgi:hypothetical protein